MTDVGKELAEVILDFMNDVLIVYQNDSKHLYNLEASPSEGTAYRFAKIDLERYPDIIVAGDTEPNYTNSSQLPVGHTEDLFDALDHQESLQIKYTGGTVFRGFVDEGDESIETIKDTLKKVTSNYRIPYLTLTPTIGVSKLIKSLPSEV